MITSVRYLSLLTSLTAIAASVPAARADGPAGSGAGYNTSRVGPDNANCTRQIYQLDLTSSNVVFQNVDHNANQTYITSLFQTFLPSMSNFTGMYESSQQQNVVNNYSLSGTLCTPKNGTKNPSHVQYLIHGVGFDSSYWDFAASEEYSYVRAAADAGYTTFRYDRLGTGLSEKPSDAYNVVQSPTDLAIAIRFAQMLRSGDIGGQKFDKIVGVGHSYGSVQVQAITAHVPTALDAALLQGFSNNGTGQGPFLAGGSYSIATEVFPDRFSADELTNAYLVTAVPQANQFDFFYFPYFSAAAFNLTRATEQPATQGVLFTQTAIMGTAHEFTGPVHVVTGAQDLPFCYRDCYAVPPDAKYPNIPAYAQELYPKTSNFSVYIPANTGHAVNQHYSAPDVYQEMLAFVDSALM
ncbi:alpha beta-hydrolase [Rhodofomes roseus]|uniref:Alpha beta-hydrolase n=1 Tax=Rhodofomes roseus TaxID=34475 RepID=A0ABQ8KJA7_9APHY|nr:alpha beta-hydrolase [Rhodofomes roseus]KAH9837855.1 alpha beta-hydrolase [Rhodofomes roseus]